MVRSSRFDVRSLALCQGTAMAVGTQRDSAKSKLELYDHGALAVKIDSRAALQQSSLTSNIKLRTLELNLIIVNLVNGITDNICCKKFSYPVLFALAIFNIQSNQGSAKASGENQNIISVGCLWQYVGAVGTSQPNTVECSKIHPYKDRRLTRTKHKA